MKKYCVSATALLLLAISVNTMTYGTKRDETFVATGQNKSEANENTSLSEAYFRDVILEYLDRNEKFSKDVWEALKEDPELVGFLHIFPLDSSGNVDVAPGGTAGNYYLTGDYNKSLELRAMKQSIILDDSTQQTNHTEVVSLSDIAEGIKQMRCFTNTMGALSDEAFIRWYNSVPNELKNLKIVSLCKAPDGSNEHLCILKSEYDKSDKKRLIDALIPCLYNLLLTQIFCVDVKNDDEIKEKQKNALKFLILNKQIPCLALQALKNEFFVMDVRFPKNNFDENVQNFEKMLQHNIDKNKKLSKDVWKSLGTESMWRGFVDAFLIDGEFSTDNPLFEGVELNGADAENYFLITDDKEKQKNLLLFDDTHENKDSVLINYTKLYYPSGAESLKDFMFAIESGEQEGEACLPYLGRLSKKLLISWYNSIPAELDEIKELKLISLFSKEPPYSYMHFRILKSVYDKNKEQADRLIPYLYKLFLAQVFCANSREDYDEDINTFIKNNQKDAIRFLVLNDLVPWVVPLRNFTCEYNPNLLDKDALINEPSDELYGFDALFDKEDKGIIDQDFMDSAKNALLTLLVISACSWEIENDQTGEKSYVIDADRFRNIMRLRSTDDIITSSLKQVTADPKQNFLVKNILLEDSDIKFENFLNGDLSAFSKAVSNISIALSRIGGKKDNIGFYNVQKGLYANPFTAKYLLSQVCTYAKEIQTFLEGKTKLVRLSPDLPNLSLVSNISGGIFQGVHNCTAGQEEATMASLNLCIRDSFDASDLDLKRLLKVVVTLASNEIFGRVFAFSDTIAHENNRRNRSRDSVTIYSNEKAMYRAFISQALKGKYGVSFQTGIPGFHMTSDVFWQMIHKNTNGKISKKSIQNFGNIMLRANDAITENIVSSVMTDGMYLYLVDTILKHYGTFAHMIVKRYEEEKKCKGLTAKFGWEGNKRAILQDILFDMGYLSQDDFSVEIDGNIDFSLLDNCVGYRKTLIADRIFEMCTAKKIELDKVIEKLIFYISEEKVPDLLKAMRPENVDFSILDDCIGYRKTLVADKIFEICIAKKVEIEDYIEKLIFHISDAKIPDLFREMRSGNAKKMGKICLDLIKKADNEKASRRTAIADYMFDRQQFVKSIIQYVSNKKIQDFLRSIKSASNVKKMVDDCLDLIKKVNPRDMETRNRIADLLIDQCESHELDSCFIENVIPYVSCKKIPELIMKVPGTSSMADMNYFRQLTMLRGVEADKTIIADALVDGLKKQGISTQAHFVEAFIPFISREKIPDLLKTMDITNFRTEFFETLAKWCRSRTGGRELITIIADAIVEWHEENHVQIPWDFEDAAITYVSEKNIPKLLDAIKSDDMKENKNECLWLIKYEEEQDEEEELGEEEIRRIAERRMFRKDSKKRQKTIEWLLDQCESIDLSLAAEIIPYDSVEKIPNIIGKIRGIDRFDASHFKQLTADCTTDDDYEVDRYGFSKNVSGVLPSWKLEPAVAEALVDKCKKEGITVSLDFVAAVTRFIPEKKIADLLDIASPNFLNTALITKERQKMRLFVPQNYEKLSDIEKVSINCFWIIEHVCCDCILKQMEVANWLIDQHKSIDLPFIESIIRYASSSKMQKLLDAIKSDDIRETEKVCFYLMTCAKNNRRSEILSGIADWLIDQHESIDLSFVKSIIFDVSYKKVPTLLNAIKSKDMEENKKTCFELLRKKHFNNSAAIATWLIDQYESVNLQFTSEIIPYISCRDVPALIMKIEGINLIDENLFNQLVSWETNSFGAAILRQYVANALFDKHKKQNINISTDFEKMAIAYVNNGRMKDILTDLASKNVMLGMDVLSEQSDSRREETIDAIIKYYKLIDFQFAKGIIMDISEEKIASLLNAIKSDNETTKKNCFELIEGCKHSRKRREEISKWMEANCQLTRQEMDRIAPCLVSYHY